MTTFAIDDGHSNQLTAGLAEHEARKTAQRMADSRGESVYLYEIRSDADDASAGAAVSEEFKPGVIDGDEPAPGFVSWRDLTFYHCDHGEVSRGHAEWSGMLAELREGAVAGAYLTQEAFDAGSDPDLDPEAFDLPAESIDWGGYDPSPDHAQISLDNGNSTVLVDDIAESDLADVEAYLVQLLTDDQREQIAGSLYRREWVRAACRAHHTAHGDWPVRG